MPATLKPEQAAESPGEAQIRDPTPRVSDSEICMSNNLPGDAAGPGASL